MLVRQFIGRFSVCKSSLVLICNILRADLLIMLHLQCAALLLGSKRACRKVLEKKKKRKRERQDEQARPGNDASGLLLCIDHVTYLERKMDKQTGRKGSQNVG